MQNHTDRKPTEKLLIEPLLDYLHSFSSEDAEPEIRRRIALLVGLSAIGVFFLLLFGSVAFRQGNISLGAFDLITASLLTCNLVDARKRKSYHFNISVGITFISLLYVYLYITGGTSNTAFVWYFTYPLISCYLLGSVRGAIATILMAVPVLIMIVLKPEQPFFADYGINFESRFLSSYLVVGLFSYLFERTRELNREELNAINRELKSTVKAQTSELVTTSEQMAREIEERRNAHKFMRLSQEGLMTVLDSIDATIYVCDLETREILFMNKALKETYGRDLRGELCWKAFRGRSGPCDNCTVDRLVDFEKRPTGVIVWQGKNPVSGKWFNYYDRAIRWIDGRLVKIQIATDISKIKDLENERLDAEEKLHQARKMEALGTLAGGVAHDLNNILSGIVSYPDLILMGLPENSPLKKPISTIKRSGLKAAAIVQDLLTLARRGVTVTEVFDVNRTVTELLQSPELDSLRSLHPRIEVQTDLDKDLLNIEGSCTHISKSAMNLISNAFEAMPNGGVIRISTRNRYIDKTLSGYEYIREGDYAVLMVSDTGHGIANEELEKIFEPFYTSKTMGRSGTGLGMAIIWGTVKDHNGYIEVESDLGKGTTFTLYLPATRESPDPQRATPSLGKYHGSGESILVVDDVKSQREIASEMLATLGYSVASVSSGEEAVDYVSNRPVDLVVLDMIMNPGIDGLETYRRILQSNPNQKVIVASGFSKSERVREAIKLGAGEYLKKPYLLEDFGRALKKELEK